MKRRFIGGPLDGREDEVETILPGAHYSGLEGRHIYRYTGQADGVWVFEYEQFEPWPK